MKTCIFHVVFNKRSIHEAFKLTKEIGYEGVELWGREPHISHEASPERVSEIKQLAEEYGIDIVGISTYEGSFSTKSDQECEESFEKIKKYIGILDQLGAPMLRIACGGPNAFLAQEYHYEKAAYWVQKCADVAKGYDKKIIMEIHNNSLIETADDALRFLNMIDGDNVGVIHDAGNMYITDTDYGYEAIKKLGKKIFHVHVKGEQRVDDESLPVSFKNRTKHGMELFQHTMLEDSAADYTSVFAALKEIGYEGYLSCECFGNKTDVERAAGDYEEMKKLLANI